MATPPLNITNIPGAREPVLNRDGTMTRTWFLFLQNLFNLTGGGSNPTSLTDLQVVPSITTAEDPSGTQALQAVGTLPPPQDMLGIYNDLQALAVGPAAASGSLTSITAGTGITLSPDPITTTGTISLADTKVTPGSYEVTDLTVDQQGRLTKASSGTGATHTWTKAQTFDVAITKSYTFATLPATPTAGQRSFITDASATTFASKAAGGGANAVPVTYDGADWIIG